MAVKFQYNKTSLQQLDKQLKMRERALPTIKNKESALRSEVKKAKAVADGPLRAAIVHCNCPERAREVERMILDKIHVRDSFIVDTAGISTMYANDGGIIVVI